MKDRLMLEAFYLLMNTAPVFNYESLKLLLTQINTPERLWQLKQADIDGLDIPPKDIQKLFEKLEFHTLHKLIDKLNSTDAGIVLCEDKNFPAPLKNVKYPPLMLFYKGDIDILNDYKLTAIVGTRDATDYGIALTAQFAKGVLNSNQLLITGTAKGIDAEVLNICCKLKTKVVSVLASGIDKISPRESESILRTCVDNGGCYFTEFPPGVGSFKSNYPIRAKLIAMLADDIIIIEAPAKSGALHVAEEAFNYRKNVYAPVSYLFDSKFWGSHNLISQGKACLVTEYSDIIEHYK